MHTYLSIVRIPLPEDHKYEIAEGGEQERQTRYKFKEDVVVVAKMDAVGEMQE